MTIEQLTIFVTLAKTQSMSLAADDLLMSKANISKSIASLEQELGSQLFFKSRRGSLLTPFGEQLYLYALDVLHTVNQLKNFAVKEQSTSQTALIAFAECYAFLLPFIMKNFLQHFQDARLLNVMSLESHYLNQSISQLNADIYFSSIFLSDLSFLKKYENEYFIYAFYEDILYVMVDAHTRWTPNHDNFVTIAQLQNLTLLTFTNYSTASPIINHPNFFDTFLQDNGLYQTSTVIHCNNTAIIDSYLTQSHTGLLCDYYSVKDSIVFNRQKYRFLKIKPETKVIHVLLLNKCSPYFRFFNDLLYLLQNNFAETFPFFRKLNGSL